MAIIDSIQENIKRGIIDIIILVLLSNEDMYGYQIKQEIDTRSDGNISIKEGSLYGPLYRMIANKYISERRELVGKRRFRNYYHLEPLGKEYLAVMLDEYDKITTGLKNIVQWGEKNESEK